MGPEHRLEVPLYLRRSFKIFPLFKTDKLTFKSLDVCSELLFNAGFCILIEPPLCGELFRLGNTSICARYLYFRLSFCGERKCASHLFVDVYLDGIETVAGQCTIGDERNARASGNKNGNNNCYR